MDIRPSYADIWSVCSGQPRLAVPDDLDGDDTTVRDEGTACHWAAQCGFEADAPDAAFGDTAPNGVVVDASMIEAVDLYMRTVLAWPGVRHIEQPVQCHGIHPRLDGTPDFFAWDAVTRTLRIADLKYGFRVKTPRTKQLLCYVDGAARFLGVVPDTVVTCIVQPRASHREGPVRMVTRTWQDLLPELDDLARAAHSAYAPDAVCTLNRGCFDCSGRVRCDTFSDAAFGRADAVHYAIPHDLTFSEQEAQLRYMHDSVDIMQAYVTGLERQVEHAIRNGARSRYFSMRSGVTPLQWDPGTADSVRALANLMGENVDKKPDLITPTQAAAVLGKSVVELYARRHPKAPKLEPDDGSKWIELLNRTTK